MEGVIDSLTDLYWCHAKVQRPFCLHFYPLLELACDRDISEF
jgi:hypothetical protein